MRGYLFPVIIFFILITTSCKRTGSNHALFGDPQKHHNEVDHHKVKYRKEPGGLLKKEDKTAKKENLKQLKEQKKAEERKRKELERYNYENNSMKTNDYDPKKKK